MADDIYIDGRFGKSGQKQIMEAVGMVEQARSGRGPMARNDRTLHITIDPALPMCEEIRTHLGWVRQQANEGHIHVVIHEEAR